MSIQDEVSSLYSRMRRKSARSAIARADHIIHHFQWQYPCCTYRLSWLIVHLKEGQE
jgi:hypothetical protein